MIVPISRRFETDHIAPCGINCGTCLAYLRQKKNRCHGCRHADQNIPKTRLNCKIRNCENLPETGSRLCSGCYLFPCDRVKHIDKRYRIRYKTSLIGNLQSIKEKGMNNFLDEESVKWCCPNCGSVLCVHRECCPECKFEVERQLQL